MGNCCRRLLISCGCLSPPRPANRRILVDHRPLDRNSLISEIEETYPNNEVISSRYTLLNFLPKNLFEQFQRIANFYFLCIAIIQLFIDAPVSPATSIIPLLFVLTVTGVKQAYEDILRHLADREVNKHLITVIRNGKKTKIEAMNIHVGDIVQCFSNEGFPCDLVLLDSSEPNGECYVTTASLDGETNLKIFKSVRETRGFANNSAAFEEGTFGAVINCQQPITDLYRFVGRMEVREGKEEVRVRSLDASNLLLRGAVLKNTDFVYACAVYTGQHTKMALNCAGKRSKYSRIELRLNHFLLVYLVLILAFTVVCMFVKYLYYSENQSSISSKRWYIPTVKSTVWRTVQDILGFIVIFNYLIPISLYVTIELQKFIGSKFINADLKMYDEVNNNSAKANTSDLNEELGQVEYLFSDKTGTLTENCMQFRQCSIAGLKYVELDRQLCYLSMVDEDGHSVKDPVPEILEDGFPPEVEEMFMVLALCHTARVEKKAKNPVDIKDISDGGFKEVANHQSNGNDEPEYEYQASSPDEKAFLEACARYGIIYHGVENDWHVITYQGQRRLFRMLEVFEFDADRKCMSVIVEDEDGNFYLHCKGAETSMLAKGCEGDSAVRDIIMKHVTEYAVDGLRTLVIGTRRLNPAECKSACSLVKGAQESLENREERLGEAYAALERDLRLLGCTAVEDKLQEYVMETIEDLRAAGIKVWILTGDKEETAVTISYSAGHFSPDMQLIRITKQELMGDCKRTIDTQVERLHATGRVDNRVEYGLVIDGQSLVHAIKPALRSGLLQLCLMCKTVLCCRMTPLQKAEIVKMVKENVYPEPVTAAVGDGANDVSMIQEAHVGIGIFGKEGRQAVRASDYALSRFNFLRRLILLHGHFYYHRLAYLVQYFFYKNIVFILPQFLFCSFSLYSAQTIYDTLYLMIYNLTLTSLPIYLFGLFEQHLKGDLLLRRPALYHLVRKNADLSWPEFIRWNFFGFWHGLCAFFVLYSFFNVNDIVSSDGTAMDVYTVGSHLLIMVVAIVTIKLLLETNYFSLPVLIGLLITILGNAMVMAIYTVINDVFFTLAGSLTYYWGLFKVYSFASTWLCMLITIFLAITPDLIYKTWKDYKLAHIYWSDRQMKPKKRKMSIYDSAPVRRKSMMSPTFHDNTAFEVSGESMGFNSHNVRT